MKKMAVMAVVAMMMISLAACGTKDNKTETIKDTKTTEAKTAGETNKAEETKAADNDKAQGGDLIVGTEAGFAPYEYLEGDKVVGVDMDIVQAIADSMGKKLVIQNMDFEGALMAVQQGKVDIVAAGVSVDEERAAVMDFSENYIDSTEVVVVNKANPAVTEPTGDALKDKVVGVQQGNIADLWVSNEDNTSPKEVRRYTKFAQAAEDLKNGKIDCIVMDQIPAEELVASSQDTCVILEGEPLFVDQYAIAIKKGNTEMQNEVNKVIKQLKADGKIEQFMTNHAAAK